MTAASSLPLMRRAFQELMLWPGIGSTEKLAYVVYAELPAAELDLVADVVGRAVGTVRNALAHLERLRMVERATVNGIPVVRVRTPRLDAHHAAEAAR